MSVAKANYNTNLASEYFAMSLMCRSGIDAYLSLGNKKGVDILVNTLNNKICIVEVKGVNKRNDWIVTNSGVLPIEDNLFYLLVCYHGKISDLLTRPDFWLIPSRIFKESNAYKIASNNKTVYINNKIIRESYSEYKNNLKLLEKYIAEE